MFALFLLLTRATTADQVLARYAAFHRANPSFSVDFTVNFGRQDVGGHMVFDRDVRAFADFEAPHIQYRLSATPKGLLEVNYVDHVYDEYPGSPTVHLYDSRISPMTKGVPTWLLIPDLRTLFPGNQKFSLERQERIAGATCDVVHAHVVTQMGTIEVYVSVDETGRVRHFRTVSHGAEGDATSEWRFSRVDPIANVAASAFQLTAPLGYVPYALPEAYGPVATGNHFPTGAWSGTHGGVIDVAARLGAKGGLVAVLGEDSDPSARAMASLARLRTSLPVLTLTDARHPMANTDGYDPSGKLVNRISAPDTPIFFLLDGSGKITREWMGYDAEHATAFEQDVRTTFKG